VTASPGQTPTHTNHGWDRSMKTWSPHHSTDAPPTACGSHRPTRHTPAGAAVATALLIIGSACSPAPAATSQADTPVPTTTTRPDQTPTPPSRRATHGRRPGAPRPDHAEPLSVGDFADPDLLLTGRDLSPLPPTPSTPTSRSATSKVSALHWPTPSHSSRSGPNPVTSGRPACCDSAPATSSTTPPAIAGPATNAYPWPSAAPPKGPTPTAASNPSSAPTTRAAPSTPPR
jgi:hypothetical protein